MKVCGNGPYHYGRISCGRFSLHTYIRTYMLFRKLSLTGFNFFYTIHFWFPSLYNNNLLTYLVTRGSCIDRVRGSNRPLPGYKSGTVIVSNPAQVTASPGHNEGIAFPDGPSTSLPFLLPKEEDKHSTFKPQTVFRDNFCIKLIFLRTVPSLWLCT
jgi:hypothetical protein